MLIVIHCLFNTPEAHQLIKKGIKTEDELTEMGKHITYHRVMINSRDIESVIPSITYENHAVVCMQSGDSFIVKMKADDFFNIVDHVVAHKLLCRINN